mgnify:CR=1 FL=1
MVGMTTLSPANAISWGRIIDDSLITTGNYRAEAGIDAVRKLMDVGAGGERALGSALPQHQRWLASRIAKQARRWDAGSAEDAVDDLLRADRLLKSSSLTDRQILEELLLRLEQRSARRAA